MVDRAPEVTASASESVTENQTLTFTVTAADPDGQAITSRAFRDFSLYLYNEAGRNVYRATWALQ